MTSIVGWSDISIRNITKEITTQLHKAVKVIDYFYETICKTKYTTKEIKMKIYKTETLPILNYVTETSRTRKLSNIEVLNQ